MQSTTNAHYISMFVISNKIQTNEKLNMAKRKWQKKAFFALNYADYAWLIMRNMSDIAAISLKQLSTYQICIIKLIRCSKHEKMANNLVFGYLDHSKMHFLNFE